ncbi:SPOR domain-containing protein [Frigoriflavimonas asaccharolytica]|uniref:SPOR domain-containing protein n=1 Tax=Frigoriflavimonas asaccharolytica TaxID=2735899 RepID=A0A8J8G5B9_9FLAO|nr:SPOR domain-containing protein [Frigoriflavimonas asaccharolytica]NRS91025.1 hypothetical protein [Frigoriflavimonas asaccharolytica]
MNSLHKAILICTILFSYSTFAQQVMKVDTLSGTELKISMDQKLVSDFDKLEDFCEKASSNTLSKNISSGTTKKKIYVADRALTNAEICRNNPRIAGYKIQIAVVKSNDEANEVKAYFRRRFPRLKVETDASLRPNYKILAGSYFTKSSAASDLKSIRGEFKSAVSVPYNIFCAEGK